MDEPTPKPIASDSLAFTLSVDQLRDLVRQEVQAALHGNGHVPPLLTPEQLADKLGVPRSWVYEQSRQGKIPTHRIGRYIRFSLAEIIASQRTKPN